MAKTIKIGDFIERLNNLDFKKGTKFKFLDKIYLYEYPNLTGIYEMEKPTKKEYSIFAQFDVTNLHSEIEIIEDEQEIDIQNELRTIAEFQDTTKYDRCSISVNRQVINKLVQAVKQLDKKMNTKYCENCGAELTEDNKYSDSICMDCKYCNDDE